MKGRLGLACAIVLAASAARADKLTDAEELFRRAKGLMAEKKDREACPLLEESQRLDPQTGTLLNIAICHENVGRIASAWGEFRAVEQQARSAGREDRMKLARDRAARLEPRLPRLRIVAGERPAGLVVKVDGEPKAEPLWPGFAVDPGTRLVEVSATNRLPVTVKATIEEEGMLVTVTLPKLVEPPAAKAEAVVDADAHRRENERYSANRARKTAGIVAGASGLAVLTAGAAFGILAFTTDGSASRACPAPCIDGSSAARNADSRTDRALAFANLANVAIPLGAIAAAVGAYLFFGAGPSARRSAWRGTSGPRDASFRIAW